MKDNKIISTNKIFEKRNKSKSKAKNDKTNQKSNNLLFNIKQEKPLTFHQTFSLNNITIKTNNKQSIEITRNKKENKKRPFSPQNKIEIFEKKIQILKNGNFFNSLQNIENIKQKRFSLQKRFNSLNNNFQELKKKKKYNEANRLFFENENKNIKRLLDLKENKNLKKQISEEEQSIKKFEDKLKKENKELEEKTDKIKKIEEEIIEMNKEIKKINNQNNELIKEKNSLINEINKIKKKNDNLKKNIDKYDNLSNNVLNKVEDIIKLDDYKGNKKKISKKK